MPEARGNFTRRFGERLREVRSARGLSQEDLAHAAGLHRTHVSLIERDRRAVRLDTLEKLARALQVEPASLIPNIVGAGGHRAGKAAAGNHHPDLPVLERYLPYIREYQNLAS